MTTGHAGHAEADRARQPECDRGGAEPDRPRLAGLDGQRRRDRLQRLPRRNAARRDRRRRPRTPTRPSPPTRPTATRCARSTRPGTSRTRATPRRPPRRRLPPTVTHARRRTPTPGCSGDADDQLRDQLPARRRRHASRRSRASCGSPSRGVPPGSVQSAKLRLYATTTARPTAPPSTRPAPPGPRRRSTGTPGRPRTSAATDDKGAIAGEHLGRVRRHAVRDRQRHLQLQARDDLHRRRRLLLPRGRHASGPSWW